MGRPFVVITLVVIAAAAAFWWMKQRDTASNSKSLTNGLAHSDTVNKAGPASKPTAARNAPSKQPPRRPLLTGVRKFGGKQDRQNLLRAIKAAQQQRTRSGSDDVGVEPAVEPAQGAAPVPRPTANPRLNPQLNKGRLDKKYIQSVIKGSIELVRECFTLARDTAPTAEGKVTVEFTIVGEQDVGGIVETAKIVSDNELSTNKTMSECMTQTMLSMEYPAPQGGGKVVVRYPFVFRSGPTAPAN